MATGKKLVKPRKRVSGSKAARRAGAPRKRTSPPAKASPPAKVAPPPEPAVAAGAAQPAPMSSAALDAPASMPAAEATVSPIVSASQDPAPDAIIHLGAQLTIREAVPLRAELLERVDDVDTLGLDASGVLKVDTAGLQVLLAFADQRRRAGSQVAWTGCSDAMRRAATQLGLGTALGLPAAGANA